MRRLAAGVLVWVVALTFGIPQGLCASKKAPQTTEDGLELKKETKRRLVYVRPNTTFSQYDRFALVDCHVEFSKTWVKDYNNSTREPSRRIGEDDLERARKDLSAQFRKIFSEELVKGGYALSESAAPDVLVLRPALVNISVSAPDLMTPGRTTTYASSSGQMTLYLELWDSATKTILGRVVDAQADPDMYGQRMTSVDNKAAADRILRAWAIELREKLDLARDKSGEP
jgi:hypothetical protein